MVTATKKALVDPATLTVRQCGNFVPTVKTWKIGSLTYWAVALVEGQIVTAGMLFSPTDMANPWSGGLFSEAEPVIVKPSVPEVVSRFQALAVLKIHGYFDTVNAIMIGENITELQKLAWTDSGTFVRKSPVVNSIGLVLNLTDEQLDDLFIEASTIEV
jgi:hypothetical protein